MHQQKTTEKLLSRSDKFFIDQFKLWNFFPSWFFFEFQSLHSIEHNKVTILFFSQSNVLFYPVKNQFYSSLVPLIVPFKLFQIKNSAVRVLVDVFYKTCVGRWLRPPPLLLSIHSSITGGVRGGTGPFGPVSLFISRPHLYGFIMNALHCVAHSTQRLPLAFSS